MSSTEATYRILSRVHVNKWDDALQEAVAGRRLKVQWLPTGTILDVFVPDANYSAENVDKLVRHEGAVDNQIHALGG